MRRTPDERFWAQVDKSGDCWNWTGTKTRDGYGQFGADHYRWYSHRYAYTRKVGEIPTGYVVDHMCHNTSCVRPGHLRASTPAENAQNREGAQVNSSSGIRGVSLDKASGRFHVRLRHNGRTIFIGSYTHEHDARVAAIAARRALFKFSDLQVKDF